MATVYRPGCESNRGFVPKISEEKCEKVRGRCKEEKKEEGTVKMNKRKVKPISSWCYQHQVGSMNALQRVLWSLIFLVLGVCMAKAEESEIQARKMSEKDLYPIHQVDFRWKHSWDIVNGDGMREFFAKGIKKRETARVRTQEPFREEAVKRKCGELRQRRRKESGRREGRRKERSFKKSKRTRWWSVFNAVTWKRKEEEEEKKYGSKARYPKARQGLGRWRRWLPFPLVDGTKSVRWKRCCRRFTEGINSGPQNARRIVIQRGKTNGICFLQMEAAKRRGWNEYEGGGEVFEVYLAQWVDMEYREKNMLSYKEKCDNIFFGIEHTLRKEEMEEQFNREAKGRMETCSRRSKSYR